ncbi:unnamed protein product [Dicrocoelium dendriticum]|nr:unnamed protein product [Dicrocoelium dendriticum]
MSSYEYIYFYFLEVMRLQLSFLSISFLAMATFKGAAKEAQRAMLLMKQREKEKQELELQKRKLEAEMRVGEISTKFAVHYDAIEQQLRTDTIGLVTLDEMKARQRAFMTQREKELALGRSKGLYGRPGHGGTDKKNKLQPSLLSFEEEEGEEDEEEELKEKNESTPTAPLKSTEEAKEVVEAKAEESNDSTGFGFSESGSAQSSEHTPTKRRRLGMNPAVDTSFLPDVDRDAEEKRLRIQKTAPMAVWVPPPNEYQVAFYAALSKSIETKPVENDCALIFDSVLLNLGNGYNATSGQFTAPVSGVYVFVLVVSAQSYEKAGAQLLHNGKVVLLSWCESTFWTTVTNQAILQLEKGDNVWLRCRDEAYKLHGYMYSSLSGYLLYPVTT